MRGAPFLCTLVTIASCVACSEAPMSQRSLSSALPNVLVAKCPTLQVSNIDDLTYDPATLTPPTSTTALDAMSIEYTEIQTAFANSPPFFQNQLCSLKGIYIVPTNAKHPASWGFRDPQNPANGYIGISDNLWQPDPFTHKPRMTLTDYLNHIVIPNLLSSLDIMPFYNFANQDTSMMMLISVLAHEYGHVLWNNILVTTLGGDPSFDKFCPGVFPSASWTNQIKQAPGGWRRFGDVADASVVVQDPDDPLGGDSDDSTDQEVNVATLQKFISKTKYRKARRLIYHLLGSTKRPWPSLFAAFSANEDFVETFTLYVLHNVSSPLMSLKLQIPLKDGGVLVPVDILGTIVNRPLLSGKMLCFDDYFLRNPP
jgi:hypothetical protein